MKETLIDPRITCSLTQLKVLEGISAQCPLPPMLNSGSRLTGRHATRFRGRGLNFEEFRQYQSGDDTRLIDWSVTQRTGEPHIRVYSEEKDRPIYIVADQRSSMFFGSVDSMKSVVCAEIAALCAWRAIKAGDRVGAVLLTPQTIQVIKLGRSNKHVSHLLEVLSHANQDLLKTIHEPVSSKPPTLEHALTRLRQLKSKGALIVVLSDFSEFDLSTQKAMQFLKQYNDVLAISITDPMEMAQSLPEELCMSDGRRQASIKSSNFEQINSYKQAVNETQKQLKTVVGAKGIALIELNTSGGHVQSFIEQMRGRRYV